MTIPKVKCFTGCYVQWRRLLREKIELFLGGLLYWSAVRQQSDFCLHACVLLACFNICRLPVATCFLGQVDSAERHLGHGRMSCRLWCWPTKGRALSTVPGPGTRPAVVGPGLLHVAQPASETAPVEGNDPPRTKPISFSCKYVANCTKTLGFALEVGFSVLVFALKKRKFLCVEKKKNYLRWKRENFFALKKRISLRGKQENFLMLCQLMRSNRKAQMLWNRVIRVFACTKISCVYAFCDNRGRVAAFPTQICRNWRSSHNAVA